MTCLAELPANLRRHIEVADNGCWLWTARIRRNGYGQVSYQGKTYAPHRVVYVLLVGPIPEGLESDHVCHTRDLGCVGGVACRHRRCVNPGHIEPVTRAENMRRRSIRQICCKWGHERSEGNVYHHKSGRTVCKTCHTGWARKYEAKSFPGRTRRSERLPYDEWIADILRRAAS